MNKTILSFCAAVCLLARCGAMAASLLLSGATIHTVTGETFAAGKVLIKDGKISALGTNVAASGAQSVDLSGQHLYPGMIALDTLLGLTEIGAVRATQDTTEPGEFTPDVESWVAVNPDSELIPVARANGIAFFEPVPQGALVAGQSGLVTVEGWTAEQRTFHAPIGLHVFWPTSELDLTPAESARGREKPKSLDEQAKEKKAKLRAFMDFFLDAAAYAKAKRVGNTNGAWTRVPAWEAMVEYVEHRLPIIVHADDVRDIRAAVNWADTNHFAMILADGRDAWMEADLLASKKVPVVYTHIYTLPPRVSDGYDIQFRAPSLLHKAGVRVAFGPGRGSMDAALTKNLPYLAAQAVAFGFPKDAALRAITIVPAELAGVENRVGSIEAGKEATLFATDGDVLDIRSHVTHFWINGVEVPLDSRHTRLYTKYRNRPKP
jgi:imidazolonepropionase-like amidohydrolase